MSFKVSLNYIFIMVFCFLQSTILYAKEEKEIIVERTIDLKSIEKFKSQKDFQYEIDNIEEPSFLQKFIKNIISKISQLLGDTSIDLKWLWEARYYFYFAIILILVLIVIRKSNKKLFKKPEHESFEIIEKIDQENWNQKIEFYEQTNDFKNALRCILFSSLEILDSNKHIKWQIDKTNTEYYYEIKDKTIRNNFSQIYTYYNTIWYGGFAFETQKYITVKQSMNELITVCQKNNK
ncbi:MAG: hypothetical protein N4A49_09340 [Marinifilaceae bacterium]|jgi:hypothetical protein|nr:hypothetical protein [Marinifilaceae bacterium]